MDSSSSIVEDSDKEIRNDPKKLLINAEKQINNAVKHKCKKIRKYEQDTKKFIETLHDNNIILREEVNHFQSVPASDKLEAEENACVTIIPPLSAYEKSKCINKKAFICARICLVVNILLLIGKIVACIPTNSISIISSTLDSAVDIFSSAVSWYTNYSIQKINIYKHPQGKTRLEPLGIILISCVMSVTSFQVITESIKRIVTQEQLVPEFSFYSLGIILATIFVKSILFVYCSLIKNPSSQVLAQDSRNDILSNIVVLLGFVFSKYIWRYSDPVGAILIGLYVFVNWFLTGKALIGNLIGKTASPETLQMITWMVLYHDPHIISIDTVRAFAFGTRYLVEVDIVLPQDMPLSQAHDIGAKLQTKLEGISIIERAYVHLDYESTHKPNTEHKIGVLF